MKRYLCIHKARDALIIGLVVGTLAIESYLSVLASLERLALAAGKKTYVISVGKPNPSKLGSFNSPNTLQLISPKLMYSVY
jgi:diphthamide biosynthesis protein 2